VLQRHLLERGDMSDEIGNYASQLVSGVVEDMDALNSVLHECAPEFPVEQIAPIDRNILRIALYELKAKLVPSKVAINEAVEISKEFGSESTPRFVNGVLGAAAPRVTGRATPSGAAQDGTAPSEG
jgi:N utilization substance protein B